MYNLFVLSNFSLMNGRDYMYITCHVKVARYLLVMACHRHRAIDTSSLPHGKSGKVDCCMDHKSQD